MCRFAALILASLITAMFTAATSAQPLNHIKTTLISEIAQPESGQKVNLALVMKPEKGWHGYWSNPGDAGAPMSFRWSVPSSIEVGEIQYPTPRKLTIAGLMNHVYSSEYALIIPIKIAAGLASGTAIPVSLNAQWLACSDQLCVPESARLSTTLKVGRGDIDPHNQQAFDRLREAMPRPLNQAAHYARNGDVLTISIPYPANAPLEDPWLYVRSFGQTVYGGKQHIYRSDNALIVELAAAKTFNESQSIEGVISTTPNLAFSISAIQGEIDPGIASSEQAAQTLQQLFMAFGGAFIGGLLLNIMPCVFPILSLKAISLAKLGADDQQSKMDALAYSAGIILTCVALGGLMLTIRAAGTQIGWAFQLQNPAVIAFLLVLMIGITLNLIGLFELPAIGVNSSHRHSSSFWTGALAAFVATPCTGPFMGAAMGAALIVPAPAALAIFAALGLGLAAPFIAISYSRIIRSWLPRPGSWMIRLRQLFALPMALTAIGLTWLLWRQTGAHGLALALAIGAGTTITLWRIGQQQRNGTSTTISAAIATALASASIATAATALPHQKARDLAENGDRIAFNAAKLDRLRQSGKPVFLYFTADWCLTCKVNEAAAIDTELVQSHLKSEGVTEMVGDWTTTDPAITRFLEANGRSGVPLYLYYPAGNEAPKILPQILSEEILRISIKN